MILASSVPTIVPLVAPISGDPAQSGRIANIPATPQIHVRWLERDDEGSWIVKAKFAKQGWILLEDLYAAEGDHEGWAYYQRYLEKWQAGKTRVSFPKDRLPKEVLRRQNGGADPEFHDEFASAPTTGRVPKVKADPK